MEHTKEPWGPGVEIFMSAKAGEKFGPAFIHPHGHSQELCEANARRIVACVNACAGLSTDLLEKAAITAANIEARERLSFCTQQIEAERDQLMLQNAQLLAALRDVISWVPGREKWHTDEPIKAVERARAVMDATVKESLTVDHQASSGASVEQQLATERASLFAESQRKQQLEQQVEELVGVLESVLPWVVTQEVACHGLKCREPVCMSCSSDSEEAAEKATYAYEESRAAIQKVRGVE